MIQRFAGFAGGIFVGVLLAGCSVFKPAPGGSANPMPDTIMPSRVTAVGYGTVPNMDGLSVAQQRLAVQPPKPEAPKAETISAAAPPASMAVASAVATRNFYYAR